MVALRDEHKYCERREDCCIGEDLADLVSDAEAEDKDMSKLCTQAEMIYLADEIAAAGMEANEFHRDLTEKMLRQGADAVARVAQVEKRWAKLDAWLLAALRERGDSQRANVLCEVDTKMVELEATDE